MTFSSKTKGENLAEIYETKVTHEKKVHNLCITIIIPVVSNRKKAGLDVARDGKQQKRKGNLPAYLT